MTDTRREFLKKASLLTGGVSLMNLLPPVIQQAMAINPEPGSTFYDAEHIVFLMQENRSFDHIFGSLQGVRGFNDPRAIRLPNGNPVFLQTDKNGDTFAPFRLNTLESKIAWMGSLPHGWSDQTDARNDGKYDRWLEVKQTRKKEYEHIPLTLGYCTREDFPFYYSLADAFTVCDHHFCSSITGTHSNRYYWMSGSIRDNPQDHTSMAHVWNNANLATPELGWKTFPERLQAAGVPWKIYQNDLTMGRSLSLPSEPWLGNFGTNVMEFFKQYNVRLEESRRKLSVLKKENLLEFIAQNQTPGDEPTQKQVAAAKKLLTQVEADLERYTQARFDELSATEKSIHQNAFITNAGSPDYREMEKLELGKGKEARTMEIPKGDILHQFRSDVENGKLPTVSWLSPPANFSDHPSLPWFGPWYVSEVMQILLKNPEVWKKTIVVLTYDENDGFYDHFAPFVVPNPYKKESGKVSAGIDPRLDFVTKEQQVNPSASADRLRDAPLGLGYRVPMVIMSPWSRGGFVNSEVFDHTSSIQFLEKFLSRKTGKKIVEANITEWRRTICGDLTSVFREYQPDGGASPAFVDKIQFISQVNAAQYKDAPKGFKKLTAEEIAAISTDAAKSDYAPKQESGVRPASALPYELYLDRVFDKASFRLQFAAGKDRFGEKSAGAPFYVYSVTPYRNENLSCRNYAVVAGDKITDEWDLNGFAEDRYHLRAHGPNGFFREFIGGGDNPALEVKVLYEKKGSGFSGNVLVSIHNRGASSQTVLITDRSYKQAAVTAGLRAGEKKNVVLPLSTSSQWYDFSVTVKGFERFAERFAGKVEIGKVGTTDPLMGRVVY